MAHEALEPRERPAPGEEGDAAENFDGPNRDHRDHGDAECAQRQQHGARETATQQEKPLARNLPVAEVHRLAGRHYLEVTAGLLGHDLMVPSRAAGAHLATKPGSSVTRPSRPRAVYRWSWVCFGGEAMVCAPSPTPAPNIPPNRPRSPSEC